MSKYIRIHPSDNVAVALEPLSSGTVIALPDGSVILKEDVPAGHKIALVDLSEGDNVIKYGYPVGHVTRDVAVGTCIDHNCLKTNLEGLLE